MQTAILDSKKDPLGAMLLDYWNGRKNIFVTINSTLVYYAAFHGWQCDRIMEDEAGKYLVRIH